MQALIQSCFVLQKLVVKPDQLIKRRGKHGLIKINTDWNGVQQWLKEHNGKEIKVGLNSWVEICYCYLFMLYCI